MHGVARELHFLAFLFMVALGFLANLGSLYLIGAGVVGLLLSYEQSLVSEHDLSQVKRAFDLNGYVGILYFASTALSIYVR